MCRGTSPTDVVAIALSPKHCHLYQNDTLPYAGNTVIGRLICFRLRHEYGSVRLDEVRLGCFS